MARFDPEVKKRIQFDKLQNLLDKYKGKQILKVQTITEELREEHYAHMPFIPTSTEVSLNLSLIDNSQTKITRDKKYPQIFILPTINKHVVKKYTPEIMAQDLDLEWEIEDSQITITHNELMYVKKIGLNEKPVRFTDKEKEGNKVTLFFDEEVISYFTNHNDSKFFKDINNVSLSYIVALRLLGLEVPEKVRDIYTKELDKKSLEIYDRINNTGLDQFSLIDVISLGLNERQFKFSPEKGVVVNLQEYLEGKINQFNEKNKKDQKK